MKKTLATLFLLTCLGSSSAYADNALILQTDFSLKDGAVSAMKGVAFGVDHNLKIFDLTHEIPPYNICLLYTSPSPRDQRGSRMPSSA